MTKHKLFGSKLYSLALLRSQASEIYRLATVASELWNQAYNNFASATSRIVFRSSLPLPRTGMASTWT